ncbi:MAG: ABC transporter permease [Streptosporangiaceae bacterium]|nr:ABC transporter permease [Streptosporangiaceae bacterium]
MSETAQQAPEVVGRPPGQPKRSPVRALRDVGALLVRQREATVFVVVVLLIIYFGFISSTGRSTFFTKTNVINLTQIAAPVIIIALGEVMLLICGEIDLSVGFVYMFAPFVMHYLIDFYHFPALLGILGALVMGVVVGWVNGFLTVTVGLPSFITTLGTGFILWGLTLTTSHAEQPSNGIPAPVRGIGHWIGQYAWAEITWAIILTVVFQILLTRTRWGLHTVATGGNQLGAREAGVSVARIKYGNFMLTSLLGAFVGLQIAFQISIVDPSSGGYTPMFYAVAAAVIGGTAMLGGSGSIIGAFLGGCMLAVLQDGFDVIGVSANPLNIILGAAILVAMIANVQLSKLRERGRV